MVYSGAERSLPELAEAVDFLFETLEYQVRRGVHRATQGREQHIHNWGKTMKAKYLGDVVVALLAVNRYPLEKAWGLLPALEANGFTDPATVPEDIGEATRKLAAAGYDRGLLTSLFAERIQRLMAAAKAGQLDGLDGLVIARKKTEAVALLCNMPGIGPKAAENAWLLVTSAAS